MEPGQCSVSKEENDVWATLVPADSRYPEISLRMQETAIRSEIVCSSFEKHNWCVITRNPNQSSATATIRNTSTGEIVVDGSVVEKEEAVDIKCGSEIIPVSDMKGYLRYTFKVLQTNVLDRKSLMISLDVEHSKCSICLNVWHDVVTVAPCLHNFCNGCFSEWLRRSQENHKGILCPQCRATILSAGRNHFLHNIEEAILRNSPLLKRSDEELALLDKCASIQSNSVLGTQKIPSRKRPSPLSSDDTAGMDLRCPQCVAQHGGFRCNQNTTHLQCHACRGMMPYRCDLGVPQNCLGCDRAFCGAYWQALGVNFGNIPRMCSQDTFKPISERTIFRIPDSTHQSNRYEQAITERCIQQTGRPLQAVISDWIVKFTNREVDRTRMALNHVEMISAQSHLCNDCYHKLVGYLLYWFRVSMPKYHLPSEASNREDCWYGYTCRTQHHNNEHAQKRNHVCRPTHGNLDAPLPS